MSSFAFYQVKTCQIFLKLEKQKRDMKSLSLSLGMCVGMSTQTHNQRVSLSDELN